MLYLHKADYEATLFKNAIFLFIDKQFLVEQGIEEPYRGYIAIEGIFTTERKVLSYANTGALNDITMIYRLSKSGSMGETNVD